MVSILQFMLLNVEFYFYNATPTGFTHMRQTFFINFELCAGSTIKISRMLKAGLQWKTVPYKMDSDGIELECC